MSVEVLMSWDNAVDVVEDGAEILFGDGGYLVVNNDNGETVSLYAPGHWLKGCVKKDKTED